MWPITNSHRVIQSLLVICIVQSGIAIRHQFFFENEDLFAPCDDVPPEAGDVHDMFDFTNYTLSYDDGDMHIVGNTTCVWKDLSPDDRIEFQVQVYKFGRGKWQPTFLSAFIYDFCTDMFQKGSLSYQVWTQNILEDDHKCFTNYGHIYHYRPYTIDTVFNFNINMEGRYNIVVKFVALTKDNIRRPNYICFSVRGEFVKI
ncbi:uncharacterized protein LOC142240913 [Haematobia irritans]|uniref:uncharacterized protein LOC142240913 n=1 Tax=Haematobia irritans TaxID=7368 RepID=UPI003F5062E3